MSEAYPGINLHLCFPHFIKEQSATALLKWAPAAAQSLAPSGCRADAVKVRSSVGRPVAGLSPSGKRTGFKAWFTDDRLGTFVLTRGEEPPLRDDLRYVTALDAPEETALGNTNAERKVGRF